MNLSKRTTANIIETSCHILFWICISIFFTHNSKLRPMAAPLKELAVVAILAGAVYLNYFVLYSQLFKKKRYWIYFPLLLIIVAVVSILEMYMVLPDIKRCLSTASPEILKGFLYNSFFYVFFRNLAFVAFSVVYKLYKEASRATELEKEKKEIEVENIKTKIAPHFLLNNLSKIHHDVLMDPEKASEKIVVISDLLRIFLKDIDAQKIPIQQEIDFISDLIALENDNRYTNLDVQFTSIGLGLDEQLSPLLFETFISNAFKYVKRENGYIHIFLRKEGKDRVRFTCENSYSQQYISNIISMRTGIENAKKRLNILYPKKHRMDITIENGIFKVDIELNLS